MEGALHGTFPNLDPGEVHGCAETAVHQVIEAQRQILQHQRFQRDDRRRRKELLPMSRRVAHHCKGDLSYVLCEAQGRKDHD